MNTLAKPDEDPTFSVLVFDKARMAEPDGERLVPGFATLAAATDYAVARVRASVEELRGQRSGAAELKALWQIYGEECVVVGEAVRAGDLIDLFIAEPASPAECDWTALAPRRRRFRAVLLVTDAQGRTAWCGGFFRAFARQSPGALLARFRGQAQDAFARQDVAPAEPLRVHVASHRALPDPPRPPAGDVRVARGWAVETTFVCHDVKFGSGAGGVFLWPEEPAGAVLDAMASVLAADMLAIRGDDPELAGFCDFSAVSVKPSEAAPDYPLD